MLVSRGLHGCPCGARFQYLSKFLYARVFFIFPLIRRFYFKAALIFTPCFSHVVKIRNDDDDRSSRFAATILPARQDPPGRCVRPFRGAEFRSRGFTMMFSTEGLQCPPVFVALRSSWNSSWRIRPSSWSGLGLSLGLSHPE